MLDLVVGDGSGEINLVLNSGTPEQRVVAAKVILRDKEAGLALLRVEKAAGLAALPLGSADELAEQMEVIACGFPDDFTRVYGVGQYPSISVNPVTVRASSGRTASSRAFRSKRNWAPAASGGRS